MLPLGSQAGQPCEDMDCHKKLATLVHEHCPVSSSHHATGGWNGYNMKFSQVPLRPFMIASIHDQVAEWPQPNQEFFSKCQCPRDTM